MTSTDATTGSETTLTAGDLFGRTFSLWGGRFAPNALLSLLFHAPLLLLAWAVLGRGTPTEKTVESWEYETRNPSGPAMLLLNNMMNQDEQNESNYRVDD